MIQELLDEGERRMRKAIEVLVQDLATVRTGRASAALIDTRAGRVLRHGDAAQSTCLGHGRRCAVTAYHTVRPLVDAATSIRRFARPTLA